MTILATYFITHKEKIFHISDLKHFLYDPAVSNPLDNARRDNMVFLVESILDHRGDIKRKTDLKFEVSWLGYGDCDNCGKHDSFLRKLQSFTTT